jgi:hypothetical protein
MDVSPARLRTALHTNENGGSDRCRRFASVGVLCMRRVRQNAIFQEPSAT